jgi:hypothetical protein
MENAPASNMEYKIICFSIRSLLGLDLYGLLRTKFDKIEEKNCVEYKLACGPKSSFCHLAKRQYVKFCILKYFEM